MSKIIAYDLGTGGLKASLFDDKGALIAFEFKSYPTYNVSSDIQEQSPNDWWNAIIGATKELIAKSGVLPDDIAALAISGHSLGVVPVDKEGNLLMERTPIWSDKRAKKEAVGFFENVDYRLWYEETGNGFPAECYSIFKIMWYKRNCTDVFNKTYKILGTKDYCNFLFTGNMATDYSYASGSGVYSLKNWEYSEKYISASGISRDILPDIVDSSAVVGNVSPKASEQTGLPTTVKVICGGVDNSCMALGAGGIYDGAVYTSLGSSAWIALSSSEPVINFKTKPYVFAHAIKGMYASATSIFSAGTSLKWVIDNLCAELTLSGVDTYKELNERAAKSPVGANALFFNPSLAGGSMLEESSDICGAFAGLSLSHTKNDVLRATMEGIALNLRIALDELRNSGSDTDEMLIVGGGSKSPFWMQMFADVYDIPTVKTSVDQEAASLGAAALAAYGVGLWSDFSLIAEQHRREVVYTPDSERRLTYNSILDKFKRLSHYMAEFGKLIKTINKNR